MKFFLAVLFLPCALASKKASASAKIVFEASVKYQAGTARPAAPELRVFDAAETRRRLQANRALRGGSSGKGGGDGYESFFTMEVDDDDQVLTLLNGEFQYVTSESDEEDFVMCNSNLDNLATLDTDDSVYAEPTGANTCQGAFSATMEGEYDKDTDCHELVAAASGSDNDYDIYCPATHTPTLEILSCREPVNVDYVPPADDDNTDDFTDDTRPRNCMDYSITYGEPEVELSTPRGNFHYLFRVSCCPVFSAADLAGR